MTAYISEIDTLGGIGNEFVEIAAPVGTDVSSFALYIYDEFGAVLSGPYALGPLQATIGNQDVYVLDNASAGLPGIRGEDAVALVDDTGTLVQFISFEGRVVTATNGPAAGQSSTDIGTSTPTGSLQSDDGGLSYYAQPNPNSGTVPCYAPGTLIDTPSGQRAVQDLRPGDSVITADNGVQQIQWVRCKDQLVRGQTEDRLPVLIKAGTLGANLPMQDLIVSPQHRILVGTAGQLTQIFDQAAFVPAKALTGLAGIRHITGRSRIAWIHFACDRHEIVCANGCLAESLLLGPMVIQAMTTSERGAVDALFGPAAQKGAALNGPVARQCLTAKAAKRQIRKRLAVGAPAARNGRKGSYKATPAAHPAAGALLSACYFARQSRISCASCSSVSM
jgi:Hint domain